jgi:signal transduction histidine kinase/ActR/RegA family two-component response regulator
MLPLDRLLRTETWTRALDKYGAATRLTAVLYSHSLERVLDPIHPAPVFQAAGGADHPLFIECARRCLADPVSVLTVERFGIGVIGTRVVVDGECVGAVVAGYAVTAFPAETAVRRFALEGRVPFPPLWRAVRQQMPLTKARLTICSELLHVLIESLLNEIVRTREYQRTAEHLADTNRAKDEFLAMLSHEIRNPLGPIQMAMQLIGSGHADAATTEQARQVVDRQVKHLVRLLDDLLDVSRITRGRIELRKQSINVTTAVANALETTRGLIETDGHALSVSLPEEPLIVDADPVRLEQIVVNLVTNAAKYTPPRGRLAVSVAREPPDAVIRVRDNGVGIPADLLPHVFELFRQGERSLARGPGGLGIGLTIVHNLVTQHGGSVTARSEGPDSGSEFTVRLPLSSAPRGTAPVLDRDRDRDRNRDRDRDRNPDGPPGRVAPLRILVIDDDRDNREVLQKSLDLAGHRVDVAEDGARGMEHVLMTRPDVALIDIGLPGMDGYQVARQIRRDLGRGIRLVALTGYGQPEDRRRAEQAGFDAYLVKPVFADQLVRALTPEGASAPSEP